MRRSELLAAANLLEHLDKLLLETRQERELSQAMVADQLGMCQTTVMRAEHGDGIRLDKVITLLRWMAE